MAQEEKHLDLLAIFHYVAGGLTAFFSCFFFVHMFVGLFLLGSSAQTGEPFPVVFAWMFILFPSIFIIGGWTLAALIIVAGRRLKQRRSYTYCLVVAAIECTIMPYGTVLGVFTIITLVKDRVKEMFAVNNTTETGPAPPAA